MYQNIQNFQERVNKSMLPLLAPSCTVLGGMVNRVFSTVSQSLSPSFTLDVESKLVNQSRSVLSVRGALPSPLSPVLCHGLQCSVRTAKNGYAAKNQKHEAVRTPLPPLSLPPSLSPPLSPLSLSVSPPWWTRASLRRRRRKRHSLFFLAGVRASEGEEGILAFWAIPSFSLYCRA